MVLWVPRRPHRTLPVVAVVGVEDFRSQRVCLLKYGLGEGGNEGWSIHNPWGEMQRVHAVFPDAVRDQDHSGNSAEAHEFSWEEARTLDLIPVENSSDVPQAQKWSVGRAVRQPAPASGDVD